MIETPRPVAAIILAAGDGTRMNSAQPKPLHAVGGLSLLRHAIHAAETMEPARLTVVTPDGADAVADAAKAAHPGAETVEQNERLGTGHAVLAARGALAAHDGDAVVLYADTPFIRAETLAEMRARRAAGADVVVLGFRAANPGGYGRLVMEGDALLAIVEAKDATPAERAIDLCNSGVVLADSGRLLSLLGEVGNDNAKGEYYLTDIVAIARRHGLKAAVVECPEAETLGVNSRADLAAAEAAFQVRAREAAMAGGATLIAPETVFFSHDTSLGRDVTVEPNVVFGPGVTVSDGAKIRGFSHLEDCAVAARAVVGPFARLRPGAEIGEGAKIGNFVEVKNARFAAGAKANHLAYIGDATVGAGANIGAGVITCNYDGVLKHRTSIGEGAFIGTNSSLVAPVSVGVGAYVASGTVLVADVPDDALAIARARQEHKLGFVARFRTKLQARKAAGAKEQS
ncbi:bifunctional UDP-N-acetylglucosamine diphosphorylase/glucosamine-1-phosphate N-acetyltransferase GlmU [Pikeienuella piscinae]|uniref:Bifunctional protein GlmU n=1 Tax=Pikeienuella piscinae TaxID=2748098 RepID=A0A7M3T6Z4_9RHOB|nr:bifunctional UDP-N-acetylglucosamine diphosphorylase/glucosamine-1-phosphate N-acetyltransferase GlmU [Pikeienuella piscinae]QIE57775.1 bifunctional UDP-N-acetylglucosamine diphosphorylase/glucosamine-1-phosphate N-acetyltransferase GlmU [Pikeienuella piscinae]